MIKTRGAIHPGEVHFISVIHLSDIFASVFEPSLPKNTRWRAHTGERVAAHEQWLRARAFAVLTFGSVIMLYLRLHHFSWYASASIVIAGMKNGESRELRRRRIVPIHTAGNFLPGRRNIQSFSSSERNTQKWNSSVSAMRANSAWVQNFSNKTCLTGKFSHCIALRCLHISILMLMIHNKKSTLQFATNAGIMGYAGYVKNIADNC